MAQPLALDRKLAALHAGSTSLDDYLLAAAFDSDMAWGLTAPGPVNLHARPTEQGGWRTRRQHLEAMGALVRQGVMDIMLASASNAEALAREGVLEGTPVTLAIRANDATDVWMPRGGSYRDTPSRPFRTASLELVRPFCDLGLYSVTFNGDLAHDLASLEAYGRFREEARRIGFRHFLEVFNPNAPAGLPEKAIPAFVNDCLTRALAGVVSAERPLFLKIAYNGPRALEELVSYDPSLVVGILGGAAGTTRDTFELLAQSARFGARVALFGRRIAGAELPLELTALMRPVIRGDLKPAEAVRAYHGAIQKQGMQPLRPLDQDLEIAEQALKEG